MLKSIPEVMPYQPEARNSKGIIELDCQGLSPNWIDVLASVFGPARNIQRNNPLSTQDLAIFDWVIEGAKEAVLTLIYIFPERLSPQCLAEVVANSRHIGYIFLSS